MRLDFVPVEILDLEMLLGNAIVSSFISKMFWKQNKNQNKSIDTRRAHVCYGNMLLCLTMLEETVHVFEKTLPCLPRTKVLEKNSCNIASTNPSE